MPNNVNDPQVTASSGGKLLMTDLTSGAAVTGQLVGAKVDLFTNNFTPTPSNVIGDFTKASYTGYAQATVAGWGSQQTTVDGRTYVIATNLMEFVGPAAGSGPTIYGYLVQNASGALLYSVKFTSPVPLTDATKALDLVVSYTLPNLQ